MPLWTYYTDRRFIVTCTIRTRRAGDWILLLVLSGYMAQPAMRGSQYSGSILKGFRGISSCLLSRFAQTRQKYLHSAMVAHIDERPIHNPLTLCSHLSFMTAHYASKTFGGFQPFTQGPVRLLT